MAEEKAKSMCMAWALCLALLALIAGPTRFLYWQESISFICSEAGLLILALCCLVLSFFRTRTGATSWQPHPFGVAIFFPIFFLIDYLARPYGFFPARAFRGEIFVLALLSPLFLRIASTRKYLVLLLLASAFFMIAFFHYSAGRPLLFDDHASFLYRLELLKQNFPNIPNYLPLWNAGIEIRDYFATGMLNIFLLFLPLVYAFPLEQTYNFIVATMLFVIFPASVYYGARLSRHESSGAALAAFLVLCSSMLWYRWSLKYGAMGFCLTAILFPLVVGFFLKLLDKEQQFTKWEALIFAFSLVLMLLWPLAGLTLIPLGLICVFKAASLLRKRYAFAIAGFVFLCYVPWAFTLFLTSNVSKFVVLDQYAAERLEKAKDQNTSGQSSSAHNTLPTPAQDSSSLADPWAGRMEVLTIRADHGPFSFSKAIKNLRDATMMSNPLILFFAIPGFCYLVRFARSALIAWAFTVQVIWLFVLAFLIGPFKPQLELERMYLPAISLLALPAALALEKLFTSWSGAKNTHKVFSSIVCAFVFFSLFSTSAIIQSKREDRYHFTQESFFRLGKAIKEYAGPGRTLFPGFVLHELAGAHLAPLIFLSEQPLVASVHIHSVWRHAELVPDYYLRRGIRGREEYFDLMNASTLVVHELPWLKRLRAHPELYEQVSHQGRFFIFKRKQASQSYFVSGAGEILEQTSSSLHLRLDTEEATIKFNYLPALEVKGCHSISPQSFPGDIHFIHISGCQPAENIEIRMQPMWKRFLGAVKKGL